VEGHAEQGRCTAVCRAVGAAVAWSRGAKPSGRASAETSRRAIGRAIPGKGRTPPCLVPSGQGAPRPLREMGEGWSMRAAAEKGRHRGGQPPGRARQRRGWCRGDSELVGRRETKRK